MSQGWVRIHRKIKECWIYDDKPFDRTHAWVDLLLRANHQDKKVLLGKELIEVKRGSFITSELKLMESWGWSKTKLRSFLKLLKDDGMVEINTDRKKTTVSIVNYNVYQDTENHEKTIEEPQENHKETIEKPIKDTNKNDKECSKNDKELYIPYREVIEYLNLKAETSYKYTGAKTQSLVKARWNEKFTLENFKTVIDNKVKDWKGKSNSQGQPLGIYLRPETLFGTKFEGYLNQNTKPKKSANEFDFSGMGGNR